MLKLLMQEVDMINPKKLSLNKKIAFGCADIFGGGAFNLMNFLYPAYAAITLGLGAGLAGTIILVARFWDALIDPIIGQISDRTRSKFGKRRIYFLIGAPLIVLSLLLAFFPWGFDSKGAKFVIALLCYMLFYTVQSFIMIPYYSLSSEISADYTERAKANTIRLSFSIFSSILCVVLPNIIVSTINNSTNSSNGYIVMSIVFGIIFAVPLIFTAFFSKEEIVTPPNKEKFSVKLFFQPVKNKAFRKYLGMQMCNGFSMAVMSGLFFFFVNYVIKADVTAANGGQGPFLGMLAAGLMFAMQIIALPFYLKLIKTKNKSYAYVIGSIIWISVALSLFFVPKNLSDSLNWIVIILAALIGFGVSGPALVPHTMVGDINDACEIQFGIRKEGAVSGILNFINQLTQALGVGVVMWVLQFCGFTEPQAGEIAVLAQPASAQTALMCFMALTPLIIMTIGIVISVRYKIDKKKQSEMVNFLEKQRTTENFDSLEEERSILLKSL